MSLATLGALAPVYCYMLDESHPEAALLYLHRQNRTCDDYYMPTARRGSGARRYGVKLCYQAREERGSSVCKARAEVLCANARATGEWPQPPPSSIPQRPPPPRPPSPDVCSGGVGITSRLNCEFFRGGSDAAATTNTEAGVFVSQFDLTHHPSKLWLPCQPSDWCWWVHDRFAGTVVNAHVPGLYNREDGGTIFAGSHVNVLCSYSFDASTTGRQLRLAAAEGTQGHTRRLAVPCPPSHKQWCNAPRAKTDRWLVHDFSYDAAYPYGDGGCAWRPGDLQWMMRQQAYASRGSPSSYNELVIDTAPYSQALPTSLAAFFIQPASSAAQRAKAAAHHAAFLSEYGRTASETPLLLYDPTARPVFACVRC